MILFHRAIATIFVLLVLQGCGTLPPLERRDGTPNAASVDFSSIPDAVPHVEPHSKYGNPETYIVNHRRYHVLSDSTGYIKRGIASWYGTKFHGRRTSSGEPYDVYAMTAAHKTLPLPTYAKVTNLENKRVVIVKINDRGPFLDNRLIDLSYAAAVKLGITDTGTGMVEVEALDPLTFQQDKKPGKAAVSGDDHKPGMYLQIGAFAEPENAERLRTRIQSIYPVNVLVTRSDETSMPVYRVRIGPITTVDEADRITSLVTAQGLGDPHIVID